MKKAKTIFCASLPEAFASVSMAYPDMGIEPGKRVRFSTNGKPNNTAGWCMVFPDGCGATFGCHREGTSFTWQQRDVSVPPPSKQERMDARAKADEACQRAEHERAARHATAAFNAASVLRDTSDADPVHSYATRKGIAPFRARQNAAGCIVLPVYGANGALQSLQFIGADGGKRFLAGSKLSGGRLFIGEPINGALLVLAEGWATGCSIHEATGFVVVVGFSGANLDDVAADLRRQYPDSPLWVAGDLDAHGKGRDYATAAAAVASGRVLLPVFSDGRDQGDFNDLAQSEGLDEVRRQLAPVPRSSEQAVVSFIEPALPTCDARDGTRDTRPLTEFGNAQRLFDAHGEHLRYVYDAQSWIAWRGGAWQGDFGAGVRLLAANLSSTIYGEGAGHLADAAHFGKWARKSQEHRTINAAVTLLSDFDSVRLPLGCLDADPLLVGFNHARQVIDLRDGAVRAATPTDYVTKSLDVGTIGSAAKAVRWTHFLNQVFACDLELIEWLQRFCGYLLTGSTREQLFLFCFGSGANGKSVFIEVLKHLMGDYSRAIASETLSESKRQAGGATPDLAALIGSRLVVCSETEDNTALAESLVKGLVSGDSMAVRRLYAAPVQFTPNFKLVMAGNHKPIVKGNDNGIWRRVRLVPFARTFAPDERDPRLLDKLKAEMPHILAWMVTGCIEWQRRGLADTPAAIRQATEAYQVEQDLTGRWLDECTSRNVQGETVNGDLYANYRAWCVDNGLRPASAVALGRRLNERSFTVRQSHGKRIWCGLTLKDSRHDRDTRGYTRAKDGY